jgi:prepilin-type N-terminal cleavage/methylation domain-containing protein
MEVRMHLAGRHSKVAQTAQGGRMTARTRMKRRRTESGFSLTELVIVIGIVLVVAAIAIPNGIRAWYNMELRGTTAEVGGLMQQARILAAKNNAYYTVCYQVNGGVQRVYLTQVTLYSTAACTYTQGTSVEIELARQITAASAAPSGTNPSAFTMSGDTSSGTPCDNTCTMAFSPRGLPCKFDTGTSPATCSTPASSYFVYYFQAASANGWSALLVTKAGRTRAYTWNGTSWN